jgi:glutamine amidotransferase
MIAIVDYGVGNLRSVKKALDYLGRESVITSSPQVVSEAQRIVLPGVGHFAATEALARLGLRDAIVTAIDHGKPFLGICVGMQWLFSGSAEAPETPGLDLFNGRCEQFNNDLKCPHVGWNTVEFCAPSRLLRGIAPGAFFYYTHSFRAPVCEGVSITTTYGEPFAAVVERENVFGVQFHPEKSASAGLALFQNFCGVEC